MSKRKLCDSLQVFALLCLPFIATAVYAQGTPLPSSPDFRPVASALARDCSACHDWAASPRSAVDAGVVKPGNPDGSLLVRVLEEGRMPPAGPGPSPEERRRIRAWVEAGAPDIAASAGGTEAVSSATEGSKTPDASTAASGSSGTSGRFLGFPSKTAFHKAAGWGSAGLLLAAGVVGAVRAYDLMSAGHAYRDENNIGEDQISSACSSYISDLWSSDQTLRWVHVSLLISGETLYFSNAVTGISWIRPTGESSRRALIHRYAFFGHATLMATEMVLGFFTTNALKRGDHEALTSLGVAHAAIGITIPLLIIGSGIVETAPIWSDR